MHPVQWQALIAQFPQLSRRQRLTGIALLQDGATQAAAIALIEQTAQADLHCPACAATRVHRHGHAHGLQRYRCVPCRKTFNALSGTPLAHLHHKTRWLAYAGCLLISDEHVCILVARDRTGQTVDFVAGRGQLSKVKLPACLPACRQSSIATFCSSRMALRRIPCLHARSASSMLR